MKYVIVTPVKDEEAFISHTINSILGQTILPQKWIIVDDGSIDDTKQVIRRGIKGHNWIELVENPTHAEERKGGSKVVRAFNVGYDKIKNEEFDFLTKLDGDLTLPSDYFEQIIFNFKNSPNLGICGGYILNKISKNQMVKERSDHQYVRGALKSIKKKCWEDIGGFKESSYWDGLDIVEARFHGWKTKSIDVPVIHHRPTGSAYDPLKLAYRSGYESYKLGNDLFLTLIRVTVRMRKKPYFKVGFSFLSGYWDAKRNLEPLIVSQELSKFIRGFHYSRLFHFFG